MLTQVKPSKKLLFKEHFKNKTTLDSVSELFVDREKEDLCNRSN